MVRDLSLRVWIAIDKGRGDIVYCVLYSNMAFEAKSSGIGFVALHIRSRVQEGASQHYYRHREK